MAYFNKTFSGFIKLNLNSSNLPVERIRLIFHAIETIPPFDVSAGVIRTTKAILFKIQQAIWESKNCTSKLDANVSYSFPFTIQMPMVQLPPAVDHDFYHCKFELIAHIDTATSLAKTTEAIRAEKSVLCMPFIETSMLKVPLQLQAQKGQLTARINMIAQEFVPGDLIPIRFYLQNNRKANNSSFQYITVCIKLIQTLHIIAFDDIGDQIKTVASVSQKLPLIPSHDTSGACSDADLALKLPPDITPSYNYGKLACISYKLRITAALKGPMRGIWNYSVTTDDIPITIGTLGYGIRSSSEIQLYTSFEQESTTNPNGMPSPKFMKAIEYEDALPLYDATKLPDYRLHDNLILARF